jgi:hypothetical protein
MGEVPGIWHSDCLAKQLLVVATGNFVSKNVIIVTRLLIRSRRNKRKENSI